MFSGAEIGIILLLIAALVVVPRVRKQAEALVDEEALGRKALASIQETHRVVKCSHPLVTEVCATFRSRLKLRVPALRALIVERPGLNAAALADGSVVLWAGLVKAVDAGDIPRDELAGLIAHEIAHIELGHGRQRVIQDLLSRPLVGRLSLLGGPIGRVAVGRGVELLRRGASREAELEADATAVRLLRQAGFDPGGLERFLGRLARMAPQEPGWTELLSTHPHLEARRARLREAV